MRKKDLIVALALVEVRIVNNMKLIDMLNTNLDDLKSDVAKLRKTIDEE